MGIRDNYQRERDAELIIKATQKLGGLRNLDDEYGSGKLTKDQRKSQEKHIPLTRRKQTLAARIKRNLID